MGSPSQPTQMESSDPMFSASSSSSSSSSPQSLYDVFLSFRGEDTRNSFTGHLYQALFQKGIRTFIDDDRLERGKEISPELLQAIRDSHYSVVVLSENFASSIPCLTDLAAIVECKGTPSGSILPIFYGVDPRVVRQQTGSYGKALAGHEINHDLEMVQSWRNALTRVGSLSGWEVTHKTDESNFIGEFIKQISRRLEAAYSQNIPRGLFGIKSRLEKFESYTVSPSSDSVQFIGICGMAGIGKTTLAKVYYSQNFYKFEGGSFLANIREICEKENGLVYLQAQLLSDILEDNNISIDNVDGGVEMIRATLQHRKVLIVLDDVDKLNQLQALAFRKDWFGSGSIIIVTARDRCVLRANGISAIYEADILSYSEASQLFSQKAFKSSNPPEDYKEMCEQVIEYANGLPLALVVLGSFLRGRSTNEWKNALNRLRMQPEKKIYEVLKVTFDNLDEIDRTIFLDIACFFNKYNEDHVIEILNCYGLFNAKKGIRNLIDKSLLSIDQHNKLHMHDLLQEMGKTIVENESPNEPGERSRIWDVADFCYVLENATGTEKVQAIVTSIEGSKKLNSFEAISQMKNLKLLMIFNPDSLCEIDSPDLEYLSNELRLLQWDIFPYKGFPSSFRPCKLVHLKLLYSSIEKLWSKHSTDLFSLKIIDLSHSWNLTKFEDFKVVPNLERLILEGCIKLLEIHDSITSLEKLIILNLASCTSLKKFPKTIKGMNSLEILNLYDCCELRELPEDCGHLMSLKVVDVRDSGIRHLPSSIFLIENLKALLDEEVANSSVRESIINPPIGHCFLPENLLNLKELDLSDCNVKDEAFPKHFGNLVSLEELNLSKNPFEVLPPDIKGLSKLKYLNLMYCKSLTHLSPDQLPSSLETLRVDYCTKLNSSLKQLEPCHFECSTYCVDCTGLVKRRGGEMTALASLKRYIQDPTHTRSYDIVIPGSKIPAWFTRQSSGPSISIRLDGNNKWIGIAFSVCFRANSMHDEFSCMVRVHGNNKKYKLVTKKIYRRSSDHFWLSYSPRDLYLECLQNGCHGLGFSFYANESNSSCCGPCGVRLVYKEEIEELNQITLKNLNRSPEDKDGEQYSRSKRSPEDEDGEQYSRSKRLKNQKGIFGSILVATIVATLVVALRHKSH
ncbi:hypothetical protein FNV43_RR20429 [Rhamnella rubrinervis]|uniref:ADP-ribosyl cyclase/cyclic ADP-ribose hydrolase n=1 Tax=Rhamnella rubrinervis TaxID=2594499 RepID=A0A8K0E0C9_9ROSA|nr:hypothetical protein FNV43_RR20429 [Rhamnella rubrinervis]